MGFMDSLSGVKKPEEGTPVLPRPEIESRLLALNADQVPFTVQAGEHSDIEAEWKIVDANWYEIFAQAHLDKSYRIYLKFDEAQHEVLALEEMWEVSWKAGVPKLRLSAEKFQGRTISAKSFGKAYAFSGVNPLNFGEVYNYRFDVSEIKDPIVAIVTGGGWTYRPVMSKRKVRK